VISVLELRQAAAGMPVIGSFGDADDPDRFVWLRSFPPCAAAQPHHLQI
jgi:hypothetical protein